MKHPIIKKIVALLVILGIEMPMYATATLASTSCDAPCQAKKTAPKNKKSPNVEISSPILQDFITGYVEERVQRGSQDLPQVLMTCYEDLKSGKISTPADAFISAMNYMFEDIVRSPRPSSCGSCTNMNTVIALLQEILCNLSGSCDISSLTILLQQCCSTLQQDFAFTWTILDNLQLNFSGTVVIDNSGIYTALDSCCKTLEQDFAFTWTILNNLNATVDISGVFTAINAQSQLIQQDFDYTWTILNNINTNNSGVFTALDTCCNTLEQDFAFTWTILNNINTNNSGVFTALDACCNTLEQDFAFTWTILNNLNATATVDLSGVFTALDTCCNTLEQDFAFTWTILNNLNATATVDLSGVYTALDACCSTLEQDFAFTWTVLGEYATSLTFTSGNPAYFPNLGPTDSTRLNAINDQVATVIEWLKMNYAMIRSIHNTLLGTGNNITIQANEM